MWNRTPLALLILTLLVFTLFAGCEDDNSSSNSQPDPYTGHPLVGVWLQQNTMYHYLDADDEIEQPSDSTWFDFRANGSAVFTQSVQAGYHQQLYSWSVDDTLLTLSSDIQMNTGVFVYEVTSDTFTYSRSLSEASVDGLTGWTYRYVKVE